MSVANILAEWLKQNGYDGLCGEECGCGLDDLAPCECSFADCVPAFKVFCPTDKGDRKCGDEYSDFTFSPNRRTGNNPCDGCPMAEEA